MKTRAQAGTGRKVVFAVLATVLFFGVAEFGFRLVVDLTSDRLESMIGEYRNRYYSHINQELKYRPHPYFGYVRRDKGANDSVNRLGFWGPERALSKPAGTARISAVRLCCVAAVPALRA